MESFRNERYQHVWSMRLSVHSIVAVIADAVEVVLLSMLMMSLLLFVGHTPRSRFKLRAGLSLARQAVRILEPDRKS